MRCEKCLSEWKSNINMEKCPFCGENLEEEEIQTEYADFSQVIQYLNNKDGNEVFLNVSLVNVYVKDLNKGQEREMQRKYAGEGSRRTRPEMSAIYYVRATNRIG